MDQPMQNAQKNLRFHVKPLNLHALKFFPRTQKQPWRKLLMEICSVKIINLFSPKDFMHVKTCGSVPPCPSEAANVQGAH
jgi:hypothetical protein